MFPQRPQLPLSVVRSRHVPAHSFCPAGQLTTQAPITQAWPEGHTRPHMPQFCRSVWRFWQAPEQLVVPAAQDTAQTPEEHT